MKYFFLTLAACTLLHLQLNAFTRNGGKEDVKATKEETNSSFSYDDGTKLLTINFIAEEMKKTQADVVEYMQSHSSYLFDVEFALPEELWKALGSSTPLIIKKGSYPLEYKDGVYTVCIQL